MTDDLDQMREALRVDQEDWMTEEEAMIRAVALLRPLFLKIDGPQLLDVLKDGRQMWSATCWYSGPDGMTSLRLNGRLR